MQSLVTMSTTEAEYVALSTAMRDVIPVMQILGEFKAHESASWLEDTECFSKSFVYVSDVSKSKGNCVKVELIVFKVQILGVSLHERKGLTFIEKSISLAFQRCVVHFCTTIFGGGRCTDFLTTL